jgi:anti-anti-sigma factor
MSAVAITSAFGPPRFAVDEQEGQLRLTGELDLAAVPELRRRVRDAALRDGAAVVDLSGIEFIDVAGLSALTSLAHEASLDRWTLQLLRPPLVVRQLARLVGMQDLARAA